MERIKISDGIYLNVIPSDKFKTNFFDINFILPLEHESASYASLLPNVLLRGCEKYPDFSSMTKRLCYLYATSISSKVYKRGDNQIVTFFSDFLKNEYVPDSYDLCFEALDTIFEILLRPKVKEGGFDKSFVETEKQNCIDAVKAQLNNKNAYAIRRCTEIMCEGEKYAVNEIGDVETLSKIDGASLFDFYKDFLSRSNIEFFFTGNVDKERLSSYLKDKFANSGSSRAGFAKKAPKKSVGEIKNVCEEQTVNQGKLVLGFRMNRSIYEKGYVRFALFDEIFGGSPTSKLFMNVREKMSLCYYCRSICEAHKSVMFVASGIENENFEKARDAIMLQLDQIKRGNISDDELHQAKMSLKNAYNELKDDAGALASWYLARIIASNTETLDEVIDAVDGVTKEDIVECAKCVTPDTVYFLKGTLKNDGIGETEADD